MASEVLHGHGLGSVNAGPHFDAVQIYFHDSFFRPQKLYESGEIDFQPFSGP